MRRQLINKKITFEKVKKLRSDGIATCESNQKPGLGHGG